jgi:hypothetical protein
VALVGVRTTGAVAERFVLMEDSKGSSGSMVSRRGWATLIVACKADADSTTANTAISVFTTTS